MKIPRYVSRFLAAHPEWSEHVDLLLVPPQSMGQEYPDAEGCDADSDAMTSYGVSRRMLYMKMRREGNAHRFADMVACQQGPGVMTDSVFFSGQPKIGDQFVDKKQRDKVFKVAKKHGYTPGLNDVYEPGLARFQGDPEAFVPPTGGRGYIRKLCEKRGWACDGAVKTSYRPPDKDPYEHSVPLAEDLIRDHMVHAIKKDPSLRSKKKALREQIIAKHGGV